MAMKFNKPSFNMVQLLGCMGRHCRCRDLPSGIKMANFSMVTTSWSPKGHTEIQTWHNLVAFGLAADMAAEIPPGSHIFIAGRLQTRKYADSEGKEKKITEVVCESLQVARIASGHRFDSTDNEDRKEEAAAPIERDDCFDPESDIPSEDIPF